MGGLGVDFNMFVSSELLNYSRNEIPARLLALPARESSSWAYHADSNRFRKHLFSSTSVEYYWTCSDSYSNRKPNTRHWTLIKHWTLVFNFLFFLKVHSDFSYLISMSSGDFYWEFCGGKKILVDVWLDLPDTITLITVMHVVCSYW